LACASGASGADLSGRVRQIMSGEQAQVLRAGQRLLLASTCLLALGLPLAGGFMDMPLAIQQRVAAVKSRMAAGFVHVAAVAHQMSAPAQAPVRVTYLPRLRIVAPPVSASPDATPISTPPLSSTQAEPISVAPSSSAGNDLDLAVKSSSAPEADYPTGEGALVDITCRTPRPLPDGDLGPKLCMHNHYWALLRSAGLELSADGKNTFDPASSPGRGPSVRRS
jgi:hypothetical protein